MIKKIGIKGLAVAGALCLTFICSGALDVNASTPVCGGNHSFGSGYVRYCGTVSQGSATLHIHTPGNYVCRVQLVRDSYLQRCACGYERVVLDNTTYYKHTRITQ